VIKESIARGCERLVRLSSSGMLVQIRPSVAEASHLRTQSMSLLGERKTVRRRADVAWKVRQRCEQMVEA
jgi:hypothetical protein